MRDPRCDPTPAVEAPADSPAVARPATFAAPLAAGPRLPARTVEPATVSTCEALAPEWDELARRLAAPPHARPGWVVAWWRAFGEGRLEIHTLRRGGRLAALVPLVARAGALHGAANYHSPELALLAEDWSAATDLARRLYGALPRRLCVVPLDPAGRGAQALLRGAEEAGYRTLLRRHPSGPALELRGEWRQFEAGLSRNLVAYLRRSQRRLETAGALSIEIADGRAGLDALLEEAFAVEASGWKGEVGTAIASRGDTGRFYGEIARWAAPEGLLRLFFLRVAGRAVAMFLALVDNGVCHLLKGGYDPAFRRCSPGQLLMREVLEFAHAHGLARVEFHGGAEPYKLRWGGTARERARFEAFAPTVAGWLGWTVAARARPALGRWLGKRPDDPRRSAPDRRMTRYADGGG
jgi:CelD/BcsL family acetyltransferase involved in cellulose biosynthesis